MKYTGDELRMKLAETVIRMSRDTDCKLTEEELLARYLTLADEESLRKLLEILDLLQGAEEEGA